MELYSIHMVSVNIMLYCGKDTKITADISICMEMEFLGIFVQF